MKNRILATLVLLLGAAGLPTAWAAPFTAFTYQGRVYDNGAPATGLYDLSFKLYNASVAGGLLGTITQTAVPTTNGLFTVVLDYGTGKFDGGERWLEIAVQSNAVPPFQTVNPRQQLTSTPYAIYTDRAGLADVAVQAQAVGLNGVPTLALQPGAVTGLKIADGNVVRSLNGLTDALSLVAGPNITVTPGSNTITISGASGGGGPAWLLNGNSGTLGGSNFLGTIDYQPLEIKVNNTRALRLEPTGATPNLIGGSFSNSVTAGVYGGTIAGGGDYFFLSNLLFDYRNLVTDEFGTVSGGAKNRAGNASGNLFDASYATVAGGFGNVASTFDSFIGGGRANTADGYAGVIAGGTGNSITNLAPYSAIAGGASNSIAAVVINGLEFSSTNSGAFAFIGGGLGNYAVGTNSGILGGLGNRTEGFGSAISGGEGNQAGGDHAFIGAGAVNFALGSHATVGGGQTNQANAQHATVSGGRDNLATADQSTIPGGKGALTIVRGQMAYANGNFATNGDAQASTYVLRTTTTATNLSSLSADGTVLKVPANSTMVFNIQLVARDASNFTTGYTLDGMIGDDPGSVGFDLLGTIRTNFVGSGAFGTTNMRFSVQPDPANHALAIKVGGGTPAKPMRWVATVRTTELVGP